VLGFWAFGVNLLHIVITVWGVVRSSRGEVFHNRVQLPFLRDASR
jgi:hypothetical protein